MGNLSIGQVVLATFPFSDLADNKVRPCFVIGLAEFGDVALCQITSKRYHSRRAVELTNNDFAEGSIVMTSFIRPDKIATLDTRMVTRILGSVSSKKLKEVKSELKQFLEV